ncbi:hypothetical protein BOX15_Mlig016442g2 [Macrostomum lignano]|uniref:Ion_trans domain-containing protein n=1 Tax=Macrostomum lignano TaxID=282301 RepID=A0A267DPS2_9PLAT|nr:hypothetical protein BOX15_Mlig016442g2 [Macrostomum lignano]
MENYSLDQVKQKLDTFPIRLEVSEKCSLIDPKKRGLILPDRSAARQICEGIIEKRDNGVDRSLALLIQAFEMDSPMILRSAFCLNMINDEEEKKFLQQMKFTNKEYEGLLREPKTGYSELEIIDAAIHVDDAKKKKISREVLPDLLATRQFELIPACTSALITLKPHVYGARGASQNEDLQQLYNKVIGIAVNALDGLFNGANRTEKEILMNYMRGTLCDEGTPPEEQGPRFPCRRSTASVQKLESCCCVKRYSSDEEVQFRTVMEMVEEASVDDLFATDCVHNLVHEEWHNRLKKSNKVTTESCSTLGKGKLYTPNQRFLCHLVGFIVFMLYFAWYIVDFRTTFQYWSPDVVMLAYAASLTMQEVNEFLRRNKRVNAVSLCGFCHCNKYLKEILNYFDMLALLFMWAGLSLKLWLTWGCFPANRDLKNDFCFFNRNNAQLLETQWFVSPQTQYVCQMILTTSFLLWGFRSVSFLNRFQRTGPVISMLKSLLVKDLVPFLLILLVIFYLFGVFFFNLLFPVVAALSSKTNTTEYRLNATVQILTLPFHLLFTNFDKIGFETTSSTESQDVGRVAHPDGFGWFNNLFMFVFLTLSNIVMLNLLIARFNLTVISMHSRALGIWRRTYYEMLQEYKNISFLPPPFSFLEYPIRIIIRCKKQHIRRSKVGQKPRGYWSHESEYPEDYLEFLKFQAAIFREIRPKLLNEITRNKSDTEILKSHAVNVSATASQNLVEYLQRLETKIESMEEILSKRKKNRKANFHRKRDFDNEPEAAPDGLEKVESS